MIREEERWRDRRKAKRKARGAKAKNPGREGLVKREKILRRKRENKVAAAEGSSGREKHDGCV